MKKISVIVAIGISMIVLQHNAFAQNATEVSSIIKPYRLAISFYKTTNLIFPYAIKSVDRGSKDVLAQKVNGVENVLQVKAGKANFDETNLTVITADGKLYSYLLNYVNNPSDLNLQFDTNDRINPDAVFSEANKNEAVLNTAAEAVAGKRRILYGIEDKNFKMKLSLNGLFIRDEVMYYQIKIENHSHINYGIDQIRFFVRDQKRSERTASQEQEIKPLFVFHKVPTVFERSEQIIVYALPKLTIPNRKYFTIELLEKQGGRHLTIKVKNRTLMKAKLI